MLFLKVIYFPIVLDVVFRGLPNSIFQHQQQILKVLVQRKYSPMETRVRIGPYHCLAVCKR